MQEKNHLVFWNIFSAFSLPGRQGPRFSFTRPTALTLQISYTEFLRLHLKYGIVFVEIIKMPLQDLFVGLFLLLQRFDLQQPTTKVQQRYSSMGDFPHERDSTEEVHNNVFSAIAVKTNGKHEKSKESVHMKLHNPTRSPAKEDCRKQTIFKAYLLAEGKQKRPAKPTAMRVYGCGGQI